MIGEMSDILKNYPAQIRDALGLGTNVVLERDIDRIVIAGVGGSAWPGDVLKSILIEEKIHIPVEIVRDYILPGYVNEKTLVFAVTYSGDTEETILMYSDALKKKAQVVVIASGGKIRWLVNEAERPVSLIRIPSGYPPRLATGFILISMLNVLRKNILQKDPISDIKQTIQALGKPEGFSRKGSELAGKLFNKIPIIYASNRFYPAAYVWKISFNETAKIHAFCNCFSELNHNELSGFIKLNGDYHVIIIRDDKEHRQIQKRMELTKGLIKKHNVDVTELMIKGNSFLTKILTAIYLGIYTAYHLAAKNDVDPSSVEMQEDLKKNLQ